MMTADQINATQKASVGQWFELADKALDETSKLMDLNLDACRETIDDLAQCCQRACDVHDLSSAIDWQSGAIKPFAERSAEYGARLVGLASGTGLDFGRSFEAQWETMGQQMRAWMGQPWLPLAGAAQPASADYLRNAMQAFDSVWASMRQNMAHAQARPSGKAGEMKTGTAGIARKRPR